MNDYAAHARGVKWMQDRLSDSCPTIRWNGQDYRIVPDSASRRSDLAPGGFQLNADLQFEALTETFLSDSITDAAALKNAILQRKITYLGDDYKVDDVRIRPGGLQIRFECSSLGQNA